MKDFQAKGEAPSPQKRTSSTSKTMEFLYFCSFFVGPFCSPGSGTSRPKSMWIHADLDPQTATLDISTMFKRKTKKIQLSAWQQSPIRNQIRCDFTPRIWWIQKHQFLAPPEKVMLMPEELRPRVANDVFFSRSMASSSILVGPQDRLTWSKHKVNSVLYIYFHNFFKYTNTPTLTRKGCVSYSTCFAIC